MILTMYLCYKFANFDTYNYEIFCLQIHIVIIAQNLELVKKMFFLVFKVIF